MSGRTPQEAVRNFLTPLKAVVGCITSEGFVVRGPRAAGEQQTAHFQDDFAILNRRNGQALKLELATTREALPARSTRVMRGRPPQHGAVAGDEGLMILRFTGDDIVEP